MPTPLGVDEGLAKLALASATAFSIKSSVIRLDGCSLNTEFIRAILAAERRASAFVGQFWKLPKQEPPGRVT